MELRDHFAGLALVGLLGQHKDYEVADNTGNYAQEPMYQISVASPLEDARLLADLAYQIADAMMEERES